MNTIIQNFFRKESRIDGRFLVLAALIAYFCVIFIGSSSGHYVETWKRLGVPANDSLFGDLSQVLMSLILFDRAIRKSFLIPILLSVILKYGGA